MSLCVWAIAVHFLLMYVCLLHEFLLYLLSFFRIFVIRSGEATDMFEAAQAALCLCMYDELPNMPNIRWIFCCVFFFSLSFLYMFVREGQKHFMPFVNNKKAPDCMHTTVTTIIICSRFILIVARDFVDTQASSLVESIHNVSCLPNIYQLWFFFLFFLFDLNLFKHKNRLLFPVYIHFIVVFLKLFHPIHSKTIN